MANEKEWQQDISTTVDAHTAKLSDHENRLNQAETNIADHEKRIDNIETTSDVGQFATRIQAVEEKNTEQDSAIDTLKKNVSDNLQTAKQYTETKLTNYATKTENTNTLEQAKQYANNKADDTLENAKQYTETKLTNYATKTENTNTLEQAKQYANSKADDALSQAKTDASQKYLPLVGGYLSGQTWVNRQLTENDTAIGVNDPASGRIYLFSGAKNRGIYIKNADNSGKVVIDINNSGRVVMYADVIHLNGTDITVG
jgi:DNA repair exonuclease SbcCD ATPase subunit